MMSGHATIDARRTGDHARGVRLSREAALHRLGCSSCRRERLALAPRRGRGPRAAGRGWSLSGELVGGSRAMSDLREQMTRAARTSASVLVTGERGTGKELVARAIHSLAAREGPLEKLNCAALTEPSSSRASSSATRPAPSPARPSSAAASSSARAAARCSSTRSGTCPCRCRRSSCACCRSVRSSASGGNETIKVDMRVVAATNRDLVRGLRDGTSSAPISTIASTSLPLHTPPLRARREDIPLLARHSSSSRVEDERSPRYQARRRRDRARSVATSFPATCESCAT